MNDLGTWTPFVAQSALLVAVMGLMWRSLTHSMQAQISRLDEKIDLKFEGVNEGLNQRFDGMTQRFEAVNQRFDAVNQRFDGVDRRLDALESDMTIIKRHLIGSLEPPRRAK